MVMLLAHLISVGLGADIMLTSRMAGFIANVLLRLAGPRARLAPVTLDKGELENGGYLPEEACGNHVAIKAAIEVVISDLAFELEQERSKGSGSRF
jgi:hypothetical protein